MLVAGRSISSLSNPNWRYLLRIGDRRGISAAAISTGAVVSNRTAPAIHDTTIRLARCERPLALARKPRRFNHAVGGAGGCDAWPSWRVVGGTMVLKVQVGQWNRPHHRGDHSCGAHPYCSHHDSVVRTVSVEWASTVYLPAASRRAPRGTTASGRALPVLIPKQLFLILWIEGFSRCIRRPGANVCRAALVGASTRTGNPIARRCNYRKLETRSACSRMTLALSLAAVPVGSPLYRILGFDQ